MNIVKEEWWATPIWFFDIPFEDVSPYKIEDECYDIKNTDSGRCISNVGGYQSNNLFVNNCHYTEIKKLLNVVASNSKIWYSELNVKEQFSGHIDNFWININSVNNYNNPHVHPASIFSGVYYVKTDDNTGNIVFNNSSNKDFICQCFTERSKYTISSVKYSTPVGRVVIFPSWVQHFVEPNLSTNDRISLAFNIM